MLETVLYAGAVGVSQVVLLVSVAFWTWLWGPLGLLMASPLTVCLVVLGKHVPGLAFVGMLMDDTPALAPEYGFYQRLLARDQSEAAELIDSHIKTEPPASVYDALLLPALSYAERDRLEHRLSSEEEAAVIEATRELISDAAEIIRRHAETEPPAAAADPSLLGPREPLRVLGYAVNGVADEVALAMLAHLLDDLPIAMEITGTRMQAVELVSLVRDAKVLCRVLRRSPTQLVVENTVSREETSLGTARVANRGGTMGTAGAGGREPADAPGRGRQSRRLSVGRESELPRRPPGDAAPSSLRTPRTLLASRHPPASIGRGSA